MSWVAARRRIQSTHNKTHRDIATVAVAVKLVSRGHIGAIKGVLIPELGVLVLEQQTESDHDKP